MIMKLGMEHYKLKLYLVYINEDPELTLTYFTTMTILEKLVFCTYGRPRYQVSVYRTIGPLVLLWHSLGIPYSYLAKINIVIK